VNDRGPRGLRAARFCPLGCRAPRLSPVAYRKPLTMNTPTKRRAGRPAYEPTDKERAQVKMLAAFGVREDDICKLLGISPPTLRKHFPGELELGHIEANAKVAQSLFRMATNPAKPNVAAAIFWLKVRAGWKDPGAVGAKEQREQDAKTADAGSSWEGLLAGPATVQ